MSQWEKRTGRTKVLKERRENSPEILDSGYASEGALLQNMKRHNRSKYNRIATLCFSFALGLTFLVLNLNLPHIARASEPTDEPDEKNASIIGLASNALACLSAGDNASHNVSGTVNLTWRGQAEKARLVMSVAGAEAAHTIKVNGHPAALAPIRSEGQFCSAEEYFYLDISPNLLVQGKNLIEITDDARPGDTWTAANVRLQVFGDIAFPPPGEPDDARQIGIANVTIAATTFIFTFTNSYDGSTQEAIAQIPDGYDGNTPTPLLLAIHPRSNAMEWGIDTFGIAANNKGWLLISPQLHGSWTGDPQPDPPGQFAYASLESQYDAVNAVSYIVDHYSVKPDQIYLAGYSMGGQGGVITAAKFPHLFAAVFDNKGPTDMAIWYDEQVAYYGNDPDHSRVVAMRQECHIDETPKTPTENPFCYQRRSGIRFASNYLHTPISITHSIGDALVPIHHSRDLRDAINSYGPDQPVLLFEDTVQGPTCPPGYHCYEPDPAMVVLDFLEPFTLNNNPTHINITTDESKSFYWMNLAQTGGDHWSQVEVTYYPISATVTALISDTAPLTVSLNLGSTPMMGIVEQPGMGLPTTTYLVKGGGHNSLHEYSSGYLTTTLLATGQFMLTISAVEAEVSAQPDVVSGRQTTTSTITVLVQDQLANPAPDGTVIQFSTTEGTFPNSSSTYIAAATGGLVTTTLTLEPIPGPSADLVEVTAGAGNITASASINVIYPDLAMQVKPSNISVYSGQTVTYSYHITNTGDVALNIVTLTDDNGTPGDSTDDITVCADIDLSVGATTICSRSTVLTQTTTNTAIATARDNLDNQVTDSYLVTVSVAPPLPRKIFLPIIVKND
jgi:pimeloyl-ACP methyl ester carboxylesterase